MYRVDSVTERENLVLASELAMAGVDFVCIPVHGEFTKKKLVALLRSQLVEIEKEVNNPKGNAL